MLPAAADPIREGRLSALSLSDLPVDAPTEQRRSVRRGRYTVVLAAFGMVITAWSLATPLMASPDESAQVAQAAAVVRGQFDEPHVRVPSGTVSFVKVPAWVLSGYLLPNCFAFKPDHPAGCHVQVPAAGPTTQAPTQFSNYPPLYFLWTGLPSLWLTGTTAMHAMRLMAVLANAVLLALGIFLLARFHPRRSALIGALVAVTPMVLFLSSVVNNSGIEITAAFAAWCGGLCVIEQRKVPRALGLWTSVTFAVFILSRPLSPVNAAVVLAVLAVLAGRRRLRTLGVDPGARCIGLTVALSMLVAGVFLAVGGLPGLLGYPLKVPLSFGTAFHEVLLRDPSRLQQGIGLFGWTDTPLPHSVPTVWIVLTTILCLVGLVRSFRFRRGLPLLALAIFLMPVIFEIPKINAVGAYWQGRYWLPLLVGIPLTAAASRSTRAHARPVALLPPLTAALVRGIAIVAICATVAWAQIDTFLLALHRYTVGLNAPASAPQAWAPLGGISATVALFITGEVLIVVALAWWCIRPQASLGDVRLHRFQLLPIRKSATEQTTAT
jgi:hypothetical protein